MIDWLVAPLAKLLVAYFATSIAWQVLHGGSAGPMGVLRDAFVDFVFAAYIPIVYLGPALAYAAALRMLPRTIPEPKRVLIGIAAIPLLATGAILIGVVLSPSALTQMTSTDLNTGLVLFGIPVLFGLLAMAPPRSVVN